MEMIAEIGKGVGGLVKEMATAFFSVLPKAFSFVMWVLAGIIILPCVYVAGNLFPLWTDWGEKTF